MSTKMTDSGPASPLVVLRAEIRRSDSTGYSQRLHCLLLIVQGFSCQAVADLFGRNPRTVERWVRLFRDQGLAGLRPEKRPGRTPKLDEQQLAAVVRDLLQNPRTFGLSKDSWDGVLLATHLRDRFGIELSIRQCQRLIRQLPRFQHFDSASESPAAEDSSARSEVNSSPEKARPMRRR